MGSGSRSTAVDAEVMRDLVELSLIEAYGWTPDYIASLPYKWIQKHNYIKRMKDLAISEKEHVQKIKQQVHRPAPGQKIIREI
jgi:hypothetical protein